MPFQYFSLNQIIPLIPSLLFLGLAVFFFKKDKIKLSLILLFLGAFGIGCFIALLDPYLHTWDEQIHALVAKNMLENPFTPILIKNPILGYDYRIWIDNHIWLHKQPLFLWQIAIFFKIFGINEFSLRLPSIIMHAIIPIFIYRIGSISIDKKIGFYGGLFFAFAYYPLELISGKYATDHNDIAFLFYLTASFWAWFEYRRSGKNYWLILIGLFSGLAVLVKWLMGLLVYICWSFSLLAEIKNIFKLITYRPMVKSFLISLLVFIPWQIYILYRFPLESRYELATFSSHFFNVVEGHDGNFWYYFESTKMLYGFGIITYFLLPISLFLLYKKIKIKKDKIFIIGTVLFVYIFYSIATTKMYSFCIIVSPFIFIGISVFFITIIDLINKRKFNRIFKNILFYIILICTCYFILDLEEIQINHTMYKPLDNDNRKGILNEMNFIENIDSILPNKKYIIFNPRYSEVGEISIMFYTDYCAYRFIPSKEQCDTVFNKGYNIAIFNFNDLPDYILSNDSILKIPTSQ